MFNPRLKDRDKLLIPAGTLKRKSISTLQRELDKVFSEFIRRRDADKFGFISCCSCGKRVYWKQSHCCHFIGRQHISTRYDERNCHAGCNFCNTFDKEIHTYQYAKFIDKKYGVGYADRLLLKSRQQTKYTWLEYSAMIEFYKKQLNEMK